MIKSILVICFTGKQSGANARELLKFGYQVEALIRDKYSNESKELAQSGAESMEDDWSNFDSFETALNDVDAVLKNF